MDSGPTWPPKDIEEEEVRAPERVGWGARELRRWREATIATWDMIGRQAGQDGGQILLLLSCLGLGCFVQGTAGSVWSYPLSTIHYKCIKQPSNKMTAQQFCIWTWCVSRLTQIEVNATLFYANITLCVLHHTLNSRYDTAGLPISQTHMKK